MSKRQVKAHANSSRAVGAFDGFTSLGFGSGQSTVLSYIQELPDYASISDPNIVVPVKNLTKKDATTKAKALEDLHSILTSPDAQVEDGLLDAWTKLFPRLSIETSRRVRQLSHTLNGAICSKCGKRVAKHLPRIAGPWLAGTFDSDRAAARAAQDAFHCVFPTADKVQGVRKTFQIAILEYCRDAALRETAATLSDERTVSADDAEATHMRVISTSLFVIASLVKELAAEDQAKALGVHEEVISSSNFWGLATEKDATVRRAIHRLVQIYAEKHPEMLNANLKRISTAYIYKGLPSEQMGSIIDYEKTLHMLSQRFPAIWTTAYSGEKPMISRLVKFLKRGSQGGSDSYWTSLSNVLKAVALDVWPTTSDRSAELLIAARSGISRKEDRFNGASAWPAYLVLVDILTNNLSESQQEPLLKNEVMPIFSEYLQSSPDTAGWAVGGSKPASTVANTVSLRQIHRELAGVWPVYGGELIEAARKSQPQQSKEFDKSQKDISKHGERWSALQRHLLEQDHNFEETMKQIFLEVNTKIMVECITILRNQNGKPYGAAAIIADILQACGDHFMKNKEFSEIYSDFIKQDSSALMFTPSQKYIAAGVFSIGDSKLFTDLFTYLMQGITDADASIEDKVAALQCLFSTRVPETAITLARNLPGFQHFISEHLSNSREPHLIALLGEVMKLKVASDHATDTVLTTLTKSLAITEQSSDSLLALEVIVSSNDGVIKDFVSNSTGLGPQLLPQVIHLEQSGDEETAERATALASRLSSAVSGASPKAKFGVIMSNLEHVTSRSLPIGAVYDLTERLIGPDKLLGSPGDMLPSSGIWESAIRSAMRPPKKSLALTSPFGGIVHSVRTEDIKGVDVAQFDSDGLSQALRIAMYISRLISTTGMLEKLGSSQGTVLKLLHISVLLAEDNMSVLGCNNMWHSHYEPEVEAMVSEFQTEAYTILAKDWSLLIDDEVPEPKANGSYSSYFYYSNLSIAKSRNNMFELQGHSTEDVKKSEGFLRQSRSQKSPIGMASCLVSHQIPLSGTQTLSRFCNELVADLTDIDVAEGGEQALEKLSLLNIVLRTHEDATEMIAKQRLIFLVKHMLQWLDPSISRALQSETSLALAALFPGIHDMYGEHWEQALKFVLDSFSSNNGSTENGEIKEDSVLTMSATLRLYTVLIKLSNSSGANDDLTDTLKENRDSTHSSLVRLLASENGAGDETHSPLMQAHELLARQTSQLAAKAEDIQELYPLLYTTSHSIQQAAFDLLHREIPKSQEQVSLDAVLDNKTAQLPDELLSLVLDCPTLDSLADESFDRRMPLTLKGYLSSWLLIFDHFSGSSQRVKDDYIEQLKSGRHLTDLLDLTFDFLGHSNGKPVDVSKLDIRNYVAGTEPSAERDVQWLLTHTYYLVLTHLPNAAKSYFLALRSRQTVLAVESWTAKYISPAIMETSLHGVSQWAETSIKEDPEYEKMSIKVGLRSHEVNASYAVDEETMAIRVVLPDEYPLTSAKVLGISRVAVPEKKWQNWLRNCQGVIAFSNGSIADGLAAWRRNVAGALKGQTECAICYSLISGDKQLPTKECPTCKHLFHSSCLFKWFKTSNANTCPLCRNPFNFN